MRVVLFSLLVLVALRVALSSPANSQDRTTPSTPAPLQATEVEVQIVKRTAPISPKPTPPRMLNADLCVPIAAGTFAGYPGDTGLDIAAKRQTVYAIAAGTLDYSENGHTRWVDPKRGDTPGSIRLKLQTPIAWRGHQVTHVYYTHLSKLTFAKAEGSAEIISVEAGAELGTSGTARGMPHLHLGLLVDNNVEQDTWESLLTEAEIRKLFGGYKNGQRLP